MFARFNLLLSGIPASRWSLFQGDLYDALPRSYPADGSSSGEGRQEPVRFDLITANPPFVPNPRVGEGVADAWFADGGASGVDVLRKIVRGAERFLSHARDPDRPTAGAGELRMVSSIAFGARSQIDYVGRVNEDDEAAAAAVGIGLDGTEGWSGEAVWKTVMGPAEYSRYYEGGAGTAADRYAEGLRGVRVGAVAVDAMIRLVYESGSAGAVVFGACETCGCDDDGDDEEDADEDQEEHEGEEGDGDDGEEEEENDEHDVGGIPQPVLLWEPAASGKWAIDLVAALSPPQQPQVCSDPQ